MAGQLLDAFERHDAAAVQRSLDAGASATALIDGKPPLVVLLEMYTRSAQFADCIGALSRGGASFDDPVLEALLLDDATRLAQLLNEAPEAHDRRFHFQCAYTTLDGVSPLHLCAEYNAVHCARVLLDRGHPIDPRAAIDSHGFGGQTPLFHTVNSNRNYCRPMMELLVEAGASLEVRLKGLVWGKGFEWETTVLDVTPLSYAQCGLYSQFHRREEAVYRNLAYLYQKRTGEPLPLRNVPNAYLDDARVFPPRQ